MNNKETDHLADWQEVIDIDTQAKQELERERVESLLVNTGEQE